MSRKINSSMSIRHTRRKMKEAHALSMDRINKYLKSNEDNSVTPSSSTFDIDKIIENENIHIEFSNAECSDAMMNLVENNNDDAVENIVYNNNNNHCETSDDDISLDNNFVYRYSSSESINSDNDECSHVTDDAFVDECDEQSNFKLDIKKWAIAHKIKHQALTALLKVLNKNVETEKFPVDSRSLLKTPRFTKISNIAGGEYHHFGLENALIDIINERIKLGVENKIIDLLISTDGAPTGKSSEKNLWPILCSEIESNTVYPIGIYYGEGKPNNVNEFLTPFVDEAVVITSDFYEYTGNKYKVNIVGLICDAPAKAMVLYVTYPSGYNSCTKCEIEGSWINRICFPTEENTSLRTDAKFKDYFYEGEYQNGVTVLNRLPLFGLVSNVPLDYMHLVCLGVMRKLLLFWTYKPLQFKLSTAQKQIISEALQNIRLFVPSEFARVPRPLQSVKKWKATEYRQFLLYIGPVILKGILREDMYSNFMALHVAITILASPYYSLIEDYLNYAEELLKYFVKTFESIYGSMFISHNVHNLLHLVNDVRTFGNLDRFSAFKFENTIFKLKNMIRKYDKPLQQITRRFSEYQRVSFENNNEKKRNIQIFEKKHNTGPVINDESSNLQYKKMRRENYFVDVDSTKNDSILVDGIFVKAYNFMKFNNTTYVIGKQLLPINETYIFPCESSKLKSSIVKLDDKLQAWPCAKIEAKLCKLSWKDTIYVFPLLHTFSS